MAFELKTSSFATKRTKTDSVINLSNSKNSIIWGSQSYKTGRHMINLAYYAGVIPVYWSQTQLKYQFTSSKWMLIKWKLTVVFFVLFDLIVLFGFYKTAEKYNFDFQLGHGIVGLYSAASALIFNSIVVHLNTLFKMDEITCFMNDWIRFYENFRGKHQSKSSNQKYAKYDNLCAKLLMFFLTQFHSSPGLLAFVTIKRCDFHILAPLLPICEATDPRNHSYLALTPILIILQWVFGSIMIHNSMLYLHFLPIFISQGIVVAKELKFQLSNKSKLAIHTQCSRFYTNYRTLQILMTQFNNCVSLLAPAHILYLVVLFGVILHYLLGMKFGLFESIISIVFLMAVFVYVIFAGSSLSQIEKTSSEVLIQANELFSNSFISRKVNRSCASLKLWIGVFGTLPKDFMVVWGVATIELLIILFFM